MSTLARLIEQANTRPKLPGAEYDVKTSSYGVFHVSYTNGMVLMARRPPSTLDHDSVTPWDEVTITYSDGHQKTMEDVTPQALVNVHNTILGFSLD